ncbi:hypothetical protein BH23GEM6_BH23GEM6_12640 [soil metagenome]
MSTHRRTSRQNWNSPRNTRHRRIVLAIVGIGLGGFLLGYLFIAVFVFRGTNRPAVVAVPELRDLPMAQARERLSRLGLEMVIGDSLPNPDVAEGAVLAQSPMAGREVLPGSGVRLILSAGRERRTVPDVAAMGRQQATRILEALGFDLVVVEQPAPLAAGRVLSIEPAAGTVLSVESRVQLTVSAGPPLASVPDVVGLLEDDARDALSSVGFRIGNVNYEFRVAEAGIVLRQHPSPGDSARVGSAVELHVATDRWEPLEP